MIDSLYGVLASGSWIWPILATLTILGALGFLGAPLLVWTISAFALLFLVGAPWWLMLVFALPAALFNVRAWRRKLVTKPIMDFMIAKKFLPVISKTEQEAIDAGTVWVDGELFSGKPNFKRLMSEPYPELTADERAFLEGPVDELCELVDDWQVWQEREIPKHVWDKAVEIGLFGMIIAPEYGGLGFSASCNSAVVSKISARCMPLGITVMVPNSLGPAELLSHYGTRQQKEFWLPRLAAGEEVPAFALTEPGAGSDAGSMTSHGEVFQDEAGELFVRLNWNKRYITLAAISTVLGLAFKLRDPANLLGKGKNLGITCALIPTNTEGVVVGERHDPLGVPFWNCPTEGHDVVVPIDAIIGGAEGAGRGWQMLMETLAAGRGISLPASSTAGVKTSARVAGAYAAIRKQFGLPIGKFEGIEEPLGRIGGYAYILEAARRYTCGGLDGGAKPSVVTAMAKYNFTEICRKAVNDAMDILGGAAISRGPRNTLAHAYVGMPISITVEGANILTRTLMIFGQGAIRCHPFALKEIEAVAKGDLNAFDRAFWGHVGHVVRNVTRAKMLFLSRGYFARTGYSGHTGRYAQRMSWASAQFASLADFAMAGLGGNLKRKETITGRFSDIFSWMYLANCTMRRFEAEGRRKEDLPFYQWSMEHAFGQMQEAFDGLFRNLRMPGTSWVWRWWGFWSRLNPIGHPPADWLGHKVAKALQTPGEQRDRITGGLYISDDREDAIGRYEWALDLCVRAEVVASKIKRAVREERLPKDKPARLVAQALDAGIIDKSEADLVAEAEAARDDAIQVDNFTIEQFFATALQGADAVAGRPSPHIPPTPHSQPV